jgi:hypothetical protein
VGGVFARVYAFGTASTPFTVPRINSSLQNKNTGYPPFYSDDPLTTCRKIVNWRAFLKFPDDAGLSPACRDLIRRLMCDVDDRLGTAGGAAVRSARRAVGCVVCSACVYVSESVYATA